MGGTADLPAVMENDMNTFIRIATLFLLLAVAAPAADGDNLNLHITTNLLDAVPGTWLRRNRPNGRAHTTYIADRRRRRSPCSSSTPTTARPWKT